MKNLMKDVKFWISIAVIIGGVLAFIALPQRVSKNERDIDQWKSVTIEQVAQTEMLISNQTALIGRDNN